MTSKTLTVKRGSVLIYRVFDIADEIDLSAIEKLLSKDSSKTRLRLERRPKQALIMRNAPVRVYLGEVELKSLGSLRDASYLAALQQPLRVEAVATFWDYGVVSILFEAKIRSGAQWSELVALSDFLTLPEPSDELDRVGRQKAQELSQIIFSALKRPEDRSLAEDYVIFFLEDLEGSEPSVPGTSKADLLPQADVPALLLGESKERLSSRSRDGILEQVYRYAESDYVVIDWNSALVFEPGGQRDIPDVLEFALTHLLEFRYFDDLLDRRLAELYDTIESRRRPGLYWGGRFTSIAREANSRFLEFSEFIERIDNSLKVVGDFYLAVIFRGAVRRFRIPDWQQTVTRKMNAFARVSELLQGEINVQRGHALELIIIILILFEIISAVFKWI